jgi:uncharacterized surface protein with fasciclin (FAS1) repeats
MAMHRNFPLALLLISLTACAGSEPTPPPANDLLTVLKTRPSLQRFAKAFESTGVAGQLQAERRYTIFAPMDKAVIDALDSSTVRHHILSGSIEFSDMAGESTTYTTLNGDEIEIDVTEQIVIGSALMVESDIGASNGVIHVIDRVQQPSGLAPAILTEPLGNTVVPKAE